MQHTTAPEWDCQQAILTPKVPYRGETFLLNNDTDFKPAKVCDFFLRMGPAHWESFAQQLQKLVGRQLFWHSRARNSKRSHSRGFSCTSPGRITLLHSGPVKLVKLASFESASGVKVSSVVPCVSCFGHETKTAMNCLMQFVHPSSAKQFSPVF